jgi:hypothetical protein
MELTAAIAVLTSVVAPFLIAWITRPDWSADKKRTTAIIVSVILGVIVAVATGQISQVPPTVQGWVIQGVLIVGIVVTLAQGAYKALLTPVKALEAATSPTSPARALAPVSVAPDVPVTEPASPSVTVEQNGTAVSDPGNGDPATRTLT